MNLHSRYAANLCEGDDLADMSNVGDDLDFPESRSAALGGKTVADGQPGVLVGFGHHLPLRVLATGFPRPIFRAISLRWLL